MVDDETWLTMKTRLIMVFKRTWSTMVTRVAINHVDDETWLTMVILQDHETRLTMVF